MTSNEDKRFPLPKQEQTRFETKRTLLGLFKQGPLETDDQFAERVARAFQQRMRERKRDKES